MAHFVDKHIEIRGVAKFDIDRLGAISELEAEQTGASCVRGRENLLNAFEEEAFVWVGPPVVVFNCVDGYRPQARALDTFFDHDLMWLPGPANEELLLLHQNLKVDICHVIERCIFSRKHRSQSPSLSAFSSNEGVTKVHKRRFFRCILLKYTLESLKVGIRLKYKFVTCRRHSKHDLASSVIKRDLFTVFPLSFE